MNIDLRMFYRRWLFTNLFFFFSETQRPLKAPNLTVCADLGKDSSDSIKI